MNKGLLKLKKMISVGVLSLLLVYMAVPYVHATTYSVKKEGNKFVSRAGTEAETIVYSAHDDRGYAVRVTVYAQCQNKKKTNYGYAKISARTAIALFGNYTTIHAYGIGKSIDWSTKWTI